MTKPTSDVIDALAQRLHSGRHMGTAIDYLEQLPTEHDGYAVQKALHRKFLQDGQEIGGWKVAASTAAQYGPLGLTRPAVGGVLAKNIVRSGTLMPMTRFVKPGIECEVALRVGPAIGAAKYPATQDEACGWIAAAVPCFEIIDNRYARLAGMNGAARIADDFLQAACVLGSEVLDWRGLNFGRLAGTLSVDGTQLASCAADPAFDALGAFAFAANLLAEQNMPLKEGDVVLTGALHKPHFLDRPGQYSFALPSLGSVSVRFE